MSYLELVEQLIKEDYLKTPAIIEAFRKINRADFLPDDLKNDAGVNAPLPIGFGQTISQPLTVAFMLELLQPKAGDKILDIGSGSGWQTTILAYIVNKNCQKSGGKVFAIERIPELMEFGKQNIAKYDFLKKGIVEIKCADGSLGWPEEVPFDKIIAAASGEKISQAWKEQLKIGGRLVVPIKGSIWLLVKESKTKFIEEEYPGFAFVPLIIDNHSSTSSL